MKNYIKWSAKLVNTQYWDLLNVSLSLEDLQRLPQYKWYVRLTIAPRKEVGQYWDTHYVFENDYGSKKEEEENKNKLVSWAIQSYMKQDTSEDLPF
jgi:hypothetical protein